MGLRVLVTGGRDFSDARAVQTTLGTVSEIDVLIHGDARGADRLCMEWAMREGIPTLAYKANWTKYGQAAGPIRNQQMLDEGKPDILVAFPGGKGTADMLRRAFSAGLEVRQFAANRSLILYEARKP